ncbi:hypothetical protein [Tropicibacter oceani]|uniref:Uncharacterized protein n=1 Tax=Tropicibacter oceani TaxID=3058420 RepID=A0ABY8QP32_9RHOB|nr:hypothetical protein [Tropicibacter oceani]WGW05592.1 hypothetical protein QF118_08600 [Tropicibacter oceani]
MQIQRLLARQVARLEQLLSRELGLKRGGLALRARRARGRLPRAVRRDLQEVAQAAHLSGHPRIAPTIDAARVDGACARALRYLEGDALREARKTRAIGLVAGIAVKVLIVVGVVVWVVWRGLA